MRSTLSHHDRLGRSDDNAALIANLVNGGHVPEMCDVTLALVKSDEGLLANGRANAAMVHRGDTALATKVRAVRVVVVQQLHVQWARDTFLLC